MARKISNEKIKCCDVCGIELDSETGENDVEVPIKKSEEIKTITICDDCWDTKEH